MWVIVHHLCGPGQWLDPWAHTLPEWAARILRGGYLAVATFFVLSGFVLALSYGESVWDRRSLARYAVARLARVYPVYALSIVVVVPFIAAESLPLTGGPLFADKASLVANYALLLQGWTGTLPVGWNTPAWSLSCEMFFYLCFPLATGMMRNSGWRTVAAVAALTCVLPEALPRLGMPAVWKPLIHLSDFVMGIAAARAWILLAESRPAWQGRGAWFYGPAALGGAALIARPGLLPAAIELNTPLRPLNALLLVGLAVGGGLPARTLASRIGVYLGKASYAMYILHVPLLWWYGRWASKLPLRLGSTGLAATFVAAVITISAAVFRYIEEPANRGLRNAVRARM